MWTKWKALMLAAILQMAHFAYADNTLPPNQSGLQPYEPVGKPMSRWDYLNNRVFVVKEKPINVEPELHTEAVSQQYIPVPKEATGEGIQWVNDGSRSGIQYRFSDHGTLRIHGARHGGETQINWSF